MFRNCLTSALRNLAHNRFYSVLAIGVLAIGLCAAILMALCIRGQLSYEHFIPGYERTYLSSTVEVLSGQAPLYDMKSPSWLAGLLKLRFTEIEAVTRLAAQDIQLRHGETEARERIYWADRNVFDLLPLPVFAGDLAAFGRPDGVVLTRSMSRKYFGRDDAVGESLQLNSHPMTVIAVIDDLPVNGTLLESGIFANGLASHSLLAQYDNDPGRIPGGGLAWDVRTYLRLAPNASIEILQQAMQAFADEAIGSAPMPGLHAYWHLIRSDRVHLFPGFNPDAHRRIAMAGALGALILLVACAVFVNLVTARAARRALEVGIRKACGASRGELILQFVAESLLQVVLATAIAVALVELLLPSVNAFTLAGAAFDYWRHPSLIVWISVGALLTGSLVGAYPAWVLASFRPADVFRKRLGSSGGAIARHALVTLQFAVLIGLIIVAGVIYSQHVYATNEALRIDTDQALIIRSPCNPTFKNELRSLAGVRGAFCSSAEFLNGISFVNFRLKDGSQQSIGMTAVEPGVFNLYGLQPVTGQFSVGGDGDSTPRNVSQYVINESAVLRLGFASPAAAIGQIVSIRKGGGTDDAGEIIGVVADFSLSSGEQAIKPWIYSITSDRYDLINVKLTGRDVPETLAGIDKLWSATGATEPVERFFLNEYLQRLYLSVLRMAQMFAIFSFIAVLLACIGLMGLAASTMQRRTKEIGIRKAMGAGTGTVMCLLIWQFARPVLWANLLAWPAAAWFLSRWLQGFAYHIDLEPWLFIASSALTLVIALVTVSAHCYLVARAKPVHALRYE